MAEQPPTPDAAPAASSRKKPGLCLAKPEHGLEFDGWMRAREAAVARLSAEERPNPLLQLSAAAAAQAAPESPGTGGAGEAPAAEEQPAEPAAAAAAESPDGGPPAKRPRMKGMNKGRQRRRNVVARSGAKPTYVGERNFFPAGFPAKWRAVFKAERAASVPRIDWVCPKCDFKNMAKFASRLCFRCCAPRSAEVEAAAAAAAAPAQPAGGDDAELAAQLGGSDEEDSPKAEGIVVDAPAAHWYEPRAKPKLDWRGKSYLSPLTTVGNLPFRRICVGLGADITCSEMATADRLLTFSPSEWSLLRRHESERCFGLQIATRHPHEARDVGRVLADAGFDYDFVDVNCGCPIDCIVGKGMGSALIEARHRNALRGIVCGLHYQPKPVTIKVRTGVDERSPTLHEWIGGIDEWGVAGITIHGRSRRQRYSRLADWDYIYKCAQLAPVPVVGNGDLLDYTVFNERISGPVSAVMTGRGALVKPWLFTEIKEQRRWDISSGERLDILRKFCNAGLEHWGADERGLSTTRRFLCEWLSFLCRYVPVGVLEQAPQNINERPQYFVGRNDLETLMASDASEDWVRISELLLGPAGNFKFTPKHKSNSYTVTATGAPLPQSGPGPIDAE